MTLNDDVEGVARAGVRAANPDYPEVQIVRELFRRRYGDRLTDTVYGALAV